MISENETPDGQETKLRVSQLEDLRIYDEQREWIYLEHTSGFSESLATIETIETMVVLTQQNLEQIRDWCSAVLSAGMERKVRDA